MFCRGNRLWIESHRRSQNGIATGAWFWRSLANGDLAPAMVDLGALVLAGVFALLARASARRAHTGEPHSVWAG